MSTHEELNVRLATLETAVADTVKKLTKHNQNENQANTGGAEADDGQAQAAAEASN